MAEENTDQSDSQRFRERHDSVDSDLSFISATHSLDDAFHKSQYEEVVDSIQKLLSKYASLPRTAITRNAIGLVKLVENKLEDNQKQIEQLHSVISQKDEEAEDAKRSYDKHISLLMEENETRFQQLIEEHEKQLSAAVERAANSRRQTISLQSQLSIAYSNNSRLECQDKKFQEEFINSLSDHQTYVEKSLAEREDLTERINVLEDKILDLEKQTREAKTGKNSSELELSTKLKENEELKKEFEKSTSLSSTKYQFLEAELAQERQQNKDLWTTQKSQSQQIAILKARLEFATKEIAHRSKMFSLFKSETVDKLSNDANQARAMCFPLMNSESSLEDLQEQLQRSDARIEDLKSQLSKKRTIEENMDRDIEQINLVLKSKSYEIQTTSDRVSKLSQRLKTLDQQIQQTAGDVKLREEGLLTLHSKLQKREKQLETLARQAHNEKLKAYDLDTTLKLSIERERTNSEKLKHLKKEEDKLSSECTIVQTRMNSMLNVLQSRKNIIVQLEAETKKAEEHMTRLFNDTVEVSLAEKYPNLYSPSMEERGERSMSLTSMASSNNSNCSMINASSKTDHEVVSMVVDSPEQSLGNIHFDRTAENKPNNETALASVPSKIIHSDTDSGVSLLNSLHSTTTTNAPNIEPPKFQSTPRKSENHLNNASTRKTPNQRLLSPVKSEQNVLSSLPADLRKSNLDKESSIPDENQKRSSTPNEIKSASYQSKIGNQSDHANNNDTADMVRAEEPSVPPAVSINIFQTTGRVRHNSLPSSAGKNRFRYRSKLQDSTYQLRRKANTETQEQSSQTVARSFLLSRTRPSVSEKSEDATTDEERLPADGLEPVLPK